MGSPTTRANASQYFDGMYLAAALVLLIVMLSMPDEQKRAPAPSSPGRVSLYQLIRPDIAPFVVVPPAPEAPPPPDRENGGATTSAKAQQQLAA